MLDARLSPAVLLAEADPEAVVAALEREEVVALMQRALDGCDPGQPLAQAAVATIAAAARRQAAWQLYLTAQAREVLALLAEAGIPALVLKGMAVCHWAYAAPHERQCKDIDLLLPSLAHVERACQLLQRRGHQRVGPGLPGDLVTFELSCVRQDARSGARLEIDLHWRLSSSPMFAFRYQWGELLATSIPVPALGPTARGLAPVPAYLHACMHLLQNVANRQQSSLKWFHDLKLIGARFETEQWQHAAQEAVDRGLARVVLAATAAAQAWFTVALPPDARARLVAAAADESFRPDLLGRWWYVQRANWASFPTLRLRLRWLRQRLLPDRAYLRARYSGSGGALSALGRRSLALLRRIRDR